MELQVGRALVNKTQASLLLTHLMGVEVIHLQLPRQEGLVVEELTRLAT